MFSFGKLITKIAHMQFEKRLYFTLARNQLEVFVCNNIILKIIFNRNIFFRMLTAMIPSFIIVHNI